MANSTKDSTVPWYMTVPDVRPTLAALSIRARCAVGSSDQSSAVTANFQPVFGNFFSLQPFLNPSPRMVRGRASKNSESSKLSGDLDDAEEFTQRLAHRKQPSADLDDAVEAGRRTMKAP